MSHALTGAQVLPAPARARCARVLDTLLASGRYHTLNRGRLVNGILIPPDLSAGPVCRWQRQRRMASGTREIRERWIGPVLHIRRILPLNLPPARVYRTA